MAARNLGQLRQAVEDLGYGADTSTAINNWIAVEYRDVAGMRHWQWLQKINTAVVTVAGTVAYTLPMTDARALEAVWVTDAQDNQFAIKWREPLKLLELSQDLTATNKGSPRYWTQYAGQLWLYPTPDAVYSLTIAYTSNPLFLTLDADIPALPEVYDEILVWGAAGRAAHRQRDLFGRDWLLQQRQPLISAMLANDSLEQRQTPYEVEETGIWNQGQASQYWR